MMPDTKFNARMDTLEQRALDEISLMVEIAKMQTFHPVKSFSAWTSLHLRIAQRKNLPLTEKIT